jgi:hypothetical protein
VKRIYRALLIFCVLVHTSPLVSNELLFAQQPPAQTNQRTGKAYGGADTVQKPPPPVSQGQSPVTFIDITTQSGIGFHHEASPTSQKYLMETMGGVVAAIDYDNDGRMDLFFTNGARLDDPMPKGAMPDKREPKYWNRLYHQKADGTFEDASVKAGVSDPQKYYGLSSAFVHINEDKLLDLIVVNDSTPKQLYINKGDGTFEEVGYQSGVALNENGREQAGMGLGIGDYDNDRRVDFYITNFSDDSNTLYHNDGEGNFTDVTAQAGHGETTLPFLGWGTSFLDFDNDGWKDILVVNGHVYPGVDEHQFARSHRGTHTRSAQRCGSPSKMKGKCYARITGSSTRAPRSPIPVGSRSSGSDS